MKYQRYLTALLAIYQNYTTSLLSLAYHHTNITRYPLEKLITGLLQSSYHIPREISVIMLKIALHPHCQHYLDTINTLMKNFYQQAQFDELEWEEINLPACASNIDDDGDAEDWELVSPTASTAMSLFSKAQGETNQLAPQENNLISVKL